LNLKGSKNNKEVEMIAESLVTEEAETEDLEAIIEIEEEMPHLLLEEEDFLKIVEMNKCIFFKVPTSHEIIFLLGHLDLIIEEEEVDLEDDLFFIILTDKEILIFLLTRTILYNIVFF
jgi:hypothetical protein